MEYFGMKIDHLVVVASLVIGALIILVGFIVGRRTGSARTKNAYAEPRVYSGSQSDTQSDTLLTPPSKGSPAKSASRKRSKKKKRREDPAEFTHPWMVGALKGHTGTVLDMNSSSDGKFLASCAEDHGVVVPQQRSAGSIQSLEAVRRQPAPIPGGAMVHPREFYEALRQQRINASRPRLEQPRQQPRELNPRPRSLRLHSINPEAEEYVPRPRQPEPIDDEPIDATTEEIEEMSRRRRKPRLGSLLNVCVSEQRRRLRFCDANVAEWLRREVVDRDNLLKYGFPVEAKDNPGKAFIFKSELHSSRATVETPKPRRKQNLDANASEFVPRNSGSSSGGDSEGDSGLVSGSSTSNSDHESDNEKLPSSPVLPRNSAPRKSAYVDPSTQHLVERTCARCSKNFLTNRTTGNYMTEDRCIHHSGKLLYGVIGKQWDCCMAEEGARGCTSGKTHVWNGTVPGLNGPLENFVKTQPSRTKPEDGNYGVFGVDCEMCYTRWGLELTQITVVGLNGEIVYETYVKPEEEIIDYNTRFSGITPKNLVNCTKTLKSVQKDLLRFISAETILIGHGLENDLRALKIMHSTVIDTSIAFPHPKGLPYRHGLKTLVKRAFDREIQAGEHNSAEDARCAVDLMLKKMETHLAECNECQRTYR